MKKYFLLLICCISVSSVYCAEDETIIEKVKDFSKKDNIIAKFLHNNMIFSSDSLGFSLLQSYRYYSVFDGKEIAKISIKVLSPFGSSFNNPEGKSKRFLERLGNGIHINTRDFVVNNALLFQEGDKVDPYIFAETERLLRKKPYVHSVRILLRKDVAGKIIVDILIRDLWSMKPKLSLNLKQQSFKDLNFLGLGGEFYLSVKDTGRKKDVFEVSYINSNLLRNYLTFYMQKLESDNELYKGVGVQRDFISPIIKWGGGLSLSRFETKVNLLSDGKPTFDQLVKADQKEVWIGHAVDLNSGNKKINQSEQVMLAVDLKKTSYELGIRGYRNLYYNDNSFFLTKFDYAKLTTFKDRFIYGHGKQEDVISGDYFSFLSGYMTGDEYSKSYWGMRFHSSLFHKKDGFGEVRLALGSFRANGKWENSVIDFDLKTFSKLYSFLDKNTRNFLSINYTYIYRPSTKSQLLNINGDNGIRSFDHDIRGEQKLNVRFETNFYSSRSFIGFKYIVFTFSDLAWITGNNKFVLDSRFFVAQGLGIRLKNEYFVMPTINLYAGLYSTKDRSNKQDFMIKLELKDIQLSDVFRFSKPSIIKK